MFTGRHYHTIDAKARIAIPHRFRDELSSSDGKLIITRSWPPRPVRSLDLIPFERYEIFLDQLRNTPMEGPDAPDLRDALLANYVHPAQEVTLDKQGRILVPPEHREYARLSRDVVTTGDVTKVRLWAAEEYEKFLVRASAFDEKASQFSGVWL